MKILLLPGLDGTGRLMEPFAKALGRAFMVEILAYPAALTSYDEVTEWLRARLPDGEYILVAESFSGPVAIEIASRPPPGLRGVVFVATFARAPRRVPGWLIGALNWLPWLPGPMARLSLPFVIGRGGDPAFVARYRAVLAEVPRRAIIGRLQAVARIDRRDRLAELRLPCAYLRAGRDWLVPAAARDFEGV